MECSKKPVITRREALRALVATSIGAIIPASISGASEPVHGACDFASVRERILKAVANGQATGVAVAMAQGGRIIWEEDFGWANRDAELKLPPTLRSASSQ
jgi:CubicO group peptidase (beta-lactamase class C family)